MAEFRSAVDYAIWNETSGRADGALTRDPRDPGGTTRWGISQRSHPGINIAMLSRADAVQIYREQYWNPEPGLALLAGQRAATKIFDHMVHLGIRGGAMAAQRAANDMIAGLLRVDGEFGPISARGVNALAEQDYLVALARRLAQTYELICQRHNATDPGYRKKFMQGFLNRARRIPA